MSVDFLFLNLQEALREMSKRPRQESDGSTRIQATTMELQKIRTDLEHRIATGDVLAVRQHLTNLMRIDVTWTQLSETRLGAVVGNLLGDATFASTFATARAIIAYWAGTLPTEIASTLKARQRKKQLQRKVNLSHDDTATALLRRDEPNEVDYDEIADSR